MARRQLSFYAKDSSMSTASRRIIRMLSANAKVNGLTSFRVDSGIVVFAAGDVFQTLRSRHDLLVQSLK
jgi:hypothetical protein